MNDDRPPDHLCRGKTTGKKDGKGTASAGKKHGKIPGVVRMWNAALRVIVPSCAVKRGITAGTAVAQGVNMESVKTVAGKPCHPKQQQAATLEGIKQNLTA
jgi:hypothetical protein